MEKTWRLLVWPWMSVSRSIAFLGLSNPLGFRGWSLPTSSTNTAYHTQIANCRWHGRAHHIVTALRRHRGLVATDLALVRGSQDRAMMQRTMIARAIAPLYPAARVAMTLGHDQALRSCHRRAAASPHHSSSQHNSSGQPARVTHVVPRTGLRCLTPSLQPLQRRRARSLRNDCICRSRRLPRKRQRSPTGRPPTKRSRERGRDLRRLQLA